MLSDEVGPKLAWFLCAGLVVACAGPEGTSSPTPCGRGACDVDAGDAGATPSDAGLVTPEDDAATPAPSPGACVITPSADPFENPEKELQWGAAGLPFPAFENVVAAPIVVDFVEDGPDDFIPEIVFVTYASRGNAVLRVVSGRAPHATLLTLAGDGRDPVVDDAAAMPSIQWDGHPAAGDLDGDGRPEVVALLRGGGAVAFRFDGRELWRADIPEAEHTPNGSLAIADLDHDGAPEVVVGRVVVDGQTGAVRWIGRESRGRNTQGPLSCIADVVPGGSMEIVAGNTVYDSRGEVVWKASGGDGFCAIADFVDGSGAASPDGAPEVVRVGNRALTFFDGATGDVVWQRSLPGCVGTGGAPTVADFDGDGRMEVGVAGASCIAVLDLDCDASPTPAGCADRGVAWTQASEDTSSAVTSSTVFDFNGDGRAEVIYNDEEYFRVFDGLTGEVIFQDPNPSRTRTEQPIVADVDFDGNAEIVFGGNYETDFAGDKLSPEDRVPGLEVWGSGDDDWVGARPIWNQHTYHIDNVEPDGTIPREEPPSWRSHNSYRLNRASEDVLAAPDLLGARLDADTSRCGEGVLLVCASVRNDGEARVGPGVEVAFFAGSADGTLIGTSTTTRGLSPREGEERVCVEWLDAPTTPTPVYAIVDAAGIARECVESNNVTPLGELRCPTLE